MNKNKPAEPDEMRMPAAEFDEIMRRALGVPPPSEAPKVGWASKGRAAKKGAPRVPAKSGPT